LIARTGPWGVKVERVEMKNVEIPTSMQRAIAQEAEALREERARLKQLESAERLRRASEIIMGNASRFSANHWRLGDSTDAPDKEGCRERANHAEIKNNSKAWTDRPASGQRIVECPRPWSADGIGASGHVNRAGRPETPVAPVIRNQGVGRIADVLRPCLRMPPVRGISALSIHVRREPASFLGAACRQQWDSRIDSLPGLGRHPIMVPFQRARRRVSPHRPRRQQCHSSM
jgi:hypothetical protein